MITQELISRINALSRKQRSVGLTDEEKSEQASLRREYLDSIRLQVADMLSRIEFTDEEIAAETALARDYHKNPQSEGHIYEVQAELTRTFVDDKHIH